MILDYQLLFMITATQFELLQFKSYIIVLCYGILSVVFFIVTLYAFVNVVLEMVSRICDVVSLRLVHNVPCYTI